MHTTNYFDTFIRVAEDSPARTAEIPPVKGENKSVANLQFEMLYDHPYKYSSDDILFNVHAVKKEIPKSDQQEARAEFFSKGQACFRASPLTKRYGWGIHSNAEGKIAMYAMESGEYKKMAEDERLKQLNAMRSKRK